MKTYEAIKPLDVPFKTADVGPVYRNDNILIVRTKIKQESFCEFDKSNPSYFRFTHEGTIVASNILSIGGNPPLDRNPFIIGELMDIGLIEVEIPEVVRDKDNVIAQAVIRCTKKMGLSKVSQ